MAHAIPAKSEGEPTESPRGAASAIREERSAPHHALAAGIAMEAHLQSVRDELMAMDGAPVLGEARSRALNHLTEAERLHGEFLRVTAHDLRNPLSAIRGQAQLLGRRLTRVESGAALDLDRVAAGMTAIDAAVGRSVNLIAALLDRTGPDHTGRDGSGG